MESFSIKSLMENFICCAVGITEDHGGQLDQF